MIQSIIKHLTYPIILRRDGYTDLYTYINQYNKSQYWPAEKMEEYQIQNVKKILIHAYNHTKFYKNRFDEVGFNPQKFYTLTDLEKIPVLTKEDLKSNLIYLIADNYNEDEIHRDATGGSTGTHTPFYRDNRSLVIKKAMEYRCNFWAGWELGDKIAYYWPAIQDFQKKKTLKDTLKNKFSYRSLMLYSGKLDNKVLEEHYQKLKKFSPILLRTFPNPLSILANYIKINNKDRFKIPSIISVGEPLLETQREQFQEVFSSNVYNCYVSRECGNMACECENKKHMHINSEMVYFEYLRSDNKKISSKILLTDLTNYGMPFIRYQIEDIGSPIYEKCSCGRNLPLLNMEAGRISDFLISPYDKSQISGASFLHHLIAEGPDVGQIQVIQDKINHLTIKIVKSRKYSKDKISHFDKVIKKIFEKKMEYEIVFVANIEREKSGKYMFTKCLIKI